tara:strand:+ start:1383 stop:1565 length:183 start_codon:yes stop_codon:yes gene_type:complete
LLALLLVPLCPLLGLLFLVSLRQAFSLESLVLKWGLEPLSGLLCWGQLRNFMVKNKRLSN